MDHQAEAMFIIFHQCAQKLFPDTDLYFKMQRSDLGGIYKIIDNEKIFVGDYILVAGHDFELLPIKYCPPNAFELA